MNHVAHALLAPRESRLLVGNLCADFVKGPVPVGMHPDFVRGIAMHRAIDAATDRHPSFVASRQRFFPKFSHYAGVIVDVVYDHLLVGDWERWACGEPFDGFAARVYAAIARHAPEFDDPVRERLLALVEHDGLRRYTTEADLRVALARTSRRLRRAVALADAVDELVEGREGLLREFASVFESLQSEGRSGPARWGPESKGLESESSGDRST